MDLEARIGDAPELDELERADLERRAEWPVSDRDRQIDEYVHAIVDHDPEVLYRMPTSPLDDAIRRRVHELEATQPQVDPTPPDELLGTDSWIEETSTRWVAVASIVHTPDERWGRFSRRSFNLPLIIRSLLTADDLRSILIDPFLEPDLVYLWSYSGPEGSLSTVHGGSHRVHAAKILDLPWLYCEVTDISLPAKLSPPVECYNPPAHWRALARRGLIDGEWDDHSLKFRVRAAPAPWLLHEPARAVALSHAYERAYPGALARLGIPPDAMNDAKSWKRWLNRGRFPIWRGLTDRWSRQTE